MDTYTYICRPALKHRAGQWDVEEILKRYDCTICYGEQDCAWLVAEKS
jgi:hypothetical protein